MSLYNNILNAVFCYELFILPDNQIENLRHAQTILVSSISTESLLMPKS